MAGRKRKAQDDLTPPPSNRPRTDNLKSLAALVKVLPHIFVRERSPLKEGSRSKMKVPCPCCWGDDIRVELSLSTLLYESHLIREHAVDEENLQFKCAAVDGCSKRFLTLDHCKKHIKEEHKKVPAKGMWLRARVQGLLFQSGNNGPYYMISEDDGLQEVTKDRQVKDGCPRIYPPFILPEYRAAFMAGTYDDQALVPSSANVAGGSGQLLPQGVSSSQVQDNHPTDVLGMQQAQQLPEISSSEITYPASGNSGQLFTKTSLPPTQDDAPNMSLQNQPAQLVSSSDVMMPSALFTFNGDTEYVHLPQAESSLIGDYTCPQNEGDGHFNFKATPYNFDIGQHKHAGANLMAQQYPTAQIGLGAEVAAYSLTTNNADPSTFEPGPLYPDFNQDDFNQDEELEDSPSHSLLDHDSWRPYTYYHLSPTPGEPPFPEPFLPIPLPEQEWSYHLNYALHGDSYDPLSTSSFLADTPPLTDDNSPGQSNRSTPLLPYQSATTMESENL